MKFDKDFKEEFNKRVNNTEWEGSEKQIKWAKKIKAQRMQDLVEYFENYGDEAGNFGGFVDGFLENVLWLAENGNAPSWIDTREKDTLNLVKDLKTN